MFARSLAVFFALTLVSGLAAADRTTPVGKWKTIDDSSKKAKSVVEIWEHKGKLYGKIIKLFKPKEPNPKCDKCRGDKKDKPIVGLVILEGLSKDGDEYTGGSITDPENGKAYKCKIKVEPDGRLKVRGFIGLSLIGRTQYWLRTK